MTRHVEPFETELKTVETESGAQQPILKRNEQNEHG